jgi:antitoxin HigA-1
VDTDISILKGLHPGIVLERELKLRKLAKGRFALSVNEFPQTLTAITKGKRKMNILLAMKLEAALELEDGFFMTLQLFYDIKKAKQKKHEQNHPDLSKIRHILFWDTAFEKIDWVQQKKAIINRVFERGNREEITEIIRFYGQQAIDEALGKN